VNRALLFSRHPGPDMEAASIVAPGVTSALPAVIVVGPLPPPYHGGSVATAFVLRSRVAAEWRVIHLDTSDRRGLRNIGRFDVGNIRLALRHVRQLLAMLREEKAAAVYVPLAQNYLGLLRDAALVLPSLVARRSVVLHLHGSGLRDFYDGADPVMRAMVRLMISRAARVIVLGEALRPMVEGLAAPDRVAVLPNGTEDDFGEAPNRAGRSGPVRVLYLGNLMRAKGFLEVIESVALLRDRGHDVELDLAGGFASFQDERDATERMAPIAAHVRLHGVVEGARKRELLEAADIFAFPSHSEGHPYVVLEAMAAALPVVTTTLPALSETVVHGTTGLLVAPRNTSDLAEAIGSLAVDAELRLRFGLAGRERFTNKYAFGVWSDGLARIVSQVIT
jgi:glycosyltransferase involved in cell wall biosynthesis